MRKPVQIERTSKKFKLIQAVGAVLAIASLPIGVTAMQTESVLLGVLTFAAFFGGLSAKICGDTLAWWHHG